MRSSLLFIVVITFFSCQNNSPQQTRELIPDPERFQYDNSSVSNVVFEPDSMIGQFKLDSNVFIDQFLGADVMENLEQENFPVAKILSSDRKQVLKLVFHPGNVNKHFSEFEIKYSTREDQNSINRKYESPIFKSNSDIQLGMTMAELLERKGKPNKSKKIDDTYLLEYLLSEHRFVKQKNYPLYFAKYEFSLQGKLISMHFGFDYP